MDLVGKLSGLDAVGQVCDRFGVDSNEEEFLRGHRSHDISQVLRRWRKVGRSGGLTVKTLAEEGGYPVIALTNRREMKGAGLYLSAGIHGDDPGPP